MSNLQEPEEIRAEIERTRAHLSRNVDAIGESVSPSNVVARQKAKAKGAFSGLKERVMGSGEEDEYALGRNEPGYITQGYLQGGSTVERSFDDDNSPSRFSEAQDRAGERLHSAGDSINAAKDSAAQALQSAPQAARQRYEGNPLAAGLIAFGAGLLAASLVPSTRREQELASQVQAKAQPLVDEARETAKDLVEDLKPAAQEAVQEVKATAQDGVEAVKAEGQSSAAQVKDDAAAAKDNVQASRE